MKNMELNDLIGEATAYDKKEKLKADKLKNWCRCSKRHRERHLECHKRVRKNSKKIIPAVWGRDYFCVRGNYFVMTLAISRTLFE